MTCSKTFSSSGVHLLGGVHHRDPQSDRADRAKRCVAKQKGGVYTVESGWRLPSERDVAAVRTRVEAAGHRP
jgi:hypothetical protein